MQNPDKRQNCENWAISIFNASPRALSNFDDFRALNLKVKNPIGKQISRQSDSEFRNEEIC